MMDAVSEDEWSRLSVDEVVELLSCDELNVPDERSVLDAALTWLNHVDVDDDDACRRPLHAARVLAAVKLPLLSPQVSFRCAYAKTKGQTAHIPYAPVTIRRPFDGHLTAYQRSLKSK